MKGGVAKTTLAVNLAHCLVQRHQKKVLLIDSILSSTPLDPSFRARDTKTLDDCGATIIDIFDTSRVTVSTVTGVGKKGALALKDIKPLELRPRFFLLPCNLQLYRLEMSPGEGRENRIKRYIQTLGDAYDIVLIDTPPTPSVWMSSALIASDFYLIPVKPEPLSSTGIDLLQAVVNQKKENYGLNLECAGVVLTMTERHTLVYSIRSRSSTAIRFGRDFATGMTFQSGPRSPQWPARNNLF